MSVSGIISYPFARLRAFEIRIVCIVYRVLSHITDLLGSFLHAEYTTFPKNRVHPVLERASTLVQDFDRLSNENIALRGEIKSISADYDRLSQRFHSIQCELERTNQTRDLLNLCKLILAGTVVPIASAFFVFFLADGSSLIARAEM